MALVPNGGQLGQSLGHSGGTARNAFGQAFDMAGRQWTTSLCNADSDGDGESNGQELGDPKCVWSLGNTPTRTDAITYPGDASSVGSGASAPSAPSADTTSGPDAPARSAAPSSTRTAAAAAAASLRAGALPAWLYAHAIIMGLAWCVLAPVGISLAFPVVRRRVGESRWLGLHRGCLLGVVVLTVVGALIPLCTDTGIEATTLAQGAHPFIGYIVLALAVLQPVNAFLRPPKPKAGDVARARSAARALAMEPEEAHRAKASTPMANTSVEEGAPPSQGAAASAAAAERASRLRRAWEFLHKNWGRVLMLLALVNIGLGINYVLDLYAVRPHRAALSYGAR
jgi:hypothetical protein